MVGYWGAEATTVSGVSATLTVVPSRISKPHLLFVEGKDEKLFFNALLKSMNSETDSLCQILEAGKAGLRKELAAVVTDHRWEIVRSIGVVRDADDDSDGAFRSVLDALAKNQLGAPRTHGEFASGQPRVGVFIMPDGVSKGALESLCLGSVDPDVGSCVDEYLECLAARADWGRDANTAQRAKAFVHAFLASGKDPVARLGEGALQGVWNFDHEVFGRIRMFLAELLAESTEQPKGD